MAAINGRKSNKLASVPCELCIMHRELCIVNCELSIVHCASCIVLYFAITLNTVLLFFALPSIVVLLAIGFVSP